MDSLIKPILSLLSEVVKADNAVTLVLMIFMFALFISQYIYSQKIIRKSELLRNHMETYESTVNAIFSKIAQEFRVYVDNLKIEDVNSKNVLVKNTDFVIAQELNIIFYDIVIKNLKKKLESLMRKIIKEGNIPDLSSADFDKYTETKYKEYESAMIFWYSEMHNEKIFFFSLNESVSDFHTRSAIYNMAFKSIMKEHKRRVDKAKIFGFIKV